MLIDFPNDRSYEYRSSFLMCDPPAGACVPQIRHPSGPLPGYPSPTIPIRKRMDRTDSRNFEPLPVGHASDATIIGVKPITSDFGIIERYEW